MKSHIKIRKTVSVCLAAAFFIALASGIVTSAITAPDFFISSNDYPEGRRINLPEADEIEVGETLQLYGLSKYGNEMPASPTDYSNLGWFADKKLTGAITWSSSDGGVASVDKNGKVTGVREGKAVIRAEYAGDDVDFIVSFAEYEIGVRSDGIPFDDLTGDKWYYNNVKYVYKNAVMKGTSDTEFSPDGTLTRAMCVTILYRVEGEPETDGEMVFTDVGSGEYYEKPVLWASKNGIVKGRTETEFVPDGPITRAEFAAMLYRYMDSVKLTLPKTKDASPSDIADIPSYAKEAVSALYRAGVVTGKGGGVFDPDANSTRAETAAMIERFLTAASPAAYRVYISPANQVGIEADTIDDLYFALFRIDRGTLDFIEDQEDRTDNKYYRSENEKKNGVFESFRSKILSGHKAAIPVIDGEGLFDNVTLLVSGACARPWIVFHDDLVEIRLTYLDDDIAEEANEKGCGWLQEKLEPGSCNTYNYMEYREKYIAEGIGQLATITVTEETVTFDGKETKALVSSYLNGTGERELVTVWVVSGNTLASVGGFPEDVWDVISRMSIGYVDMWDNAGD